MRHEVLKVTLLVDTSGSEDTYVARSDEHEIECESTSASAAMVGLMRKVRQRLWLDSVQEVGEA